MSLFATYRLLLFLILISYTLVTLTVWTWRHWPRLYDQSRRGRLLRGYSFTLLVGIRWLRYWRDLLQIVTLTAVLVTLIGLHRH